MTEQAYKYAKTVNQQTNPNAIQRNSWTNQPYALISNSDTFASSHFTQTAKKDKKGKTTVTKNHPWTVTCHNFNVNIPTGACIKKIKFVFRMRISSVTNVEIKAPHGRFCVYGSGYTSKFDNTPKGLDDGWNDGYYWSYTDSKKLTTSFANYTFTMGEDDIKLGGIKAEHLNASVFGVDMVFTDANFKYQTNRDVQVDLAWCRVEIDYEVSDYSITYTTPTYKAVDITKGVKNAKSIELPQEIKVNEDFTVTATFKNKTCANGGTQVLDVTLPWGTDLVSATPSSGTSFNSSTMKWTVNANGIKTHTLKLVLNSHKDTTSVLTIGNDNVGHSDFTYKPNWNSYDGYSDIELSFEDDVHLNQLACAYINIKGYSDDDEYAFTISNNKTITPVAVSLESGSNGVSLDSSTLSTPSSVVLTVPASEDFNASVKYCFYPNVVGSNSMTVDPVDTGSESVTLPYTVKASSTFRVNSSIVTPQKDKWRLNSASDIIENHRIVTSVETDAVVLETSVKDMDSSMDQLPCNIKMYLLDGLDYIGCVPLEQTHFDPKSTYKDKLLDSHYKNKRYMGKQLASDEDITLNVRLHPQDVTTIQGLIDMDKPIPINANHKCFEGDALNHRGWAEIYGITATETNPHWYKCEIDVKYLTHNLNTRFKIDKGNKVGDYPFDSLMAETYPTGSNLSDNELFNVDTDGTFYYADDDDVDDNHRNMFTLDESQHFNITSKDKLASTTHITFEWLNTYFDEIKENAVERIISIRDKATGNAVFTYQYYDYTFDDDSILCEVQGYRDDSNLDIGQSMELRKGVDLLDSEEDVDEVYDEYYGSKLHFILNGNTLEVIDEGFNGKEVSQGGIVLDEGEYIFDVYFKNNNQDNETGDLVCFTDITVQESILKSEFDTLYQKMYVSPFPVAKKKLLFTREAEEGTIYYYLDDGGEFSYLVEPFYNYANGTDLVTSDGVSIFNLNYGYEIVYIQNGLVRLGFNRLNGELYLGKWDNGSHSYIDTHRLQLSKYDDINTKSISDDKIEIQASDSIFTIYRGHPYIHIKHDDEEIGIYTKFNRVWAEKVGGDDSTEYPTYWDLMNNDNLLPSSIGGIETISTHDVDVEEITISDRNASSLDWGTVPSESDLMVDTDLVFEITGSTDNIIDEIDVDSATYQGYYGAYTIEQVCDNVPNVVYLNVTDNPLQIDDTIFISLKAVDGCNNPVRNGLVKFYLGDDV